MDEFKGVGKTVILCQSASHGRVAWVRYGDGSVGVRVEDRTVGVWEPHEREDAYRLFFYYMEGNDGFRDVVLLLLNQGAGPVPGMN